MKIDSLRGRSASRLQMEQQVRSVDGLHCNWYNDSSRFLDRYLSQFPIQTLWDWFRISTSIWVETIDCLTCFLRTMACQTSSGSHLSTHPQHGWTSRPSYRPKSTEFVTSYRFWRLATTWWFSYRGWWSLLLPRRLTPGLRVECLAWSRLVNGRQADEYTDLAFFCWKHAPIK